MFFDLSEYGVVIAFPVADAFRISKKIIQTSSLSI